MSDKVMICPEGLELANKYLELGSAVEAAKLLHVTLDRATEILNKPEVKRYIDSVYLDTGYRNKFTMASLMDKIILNKIEEAEESELFSGKDLVDIMQIFHKMKMEELKHEASKDNIKNQTNVQINAPGNTPFGEGNYGSLMNTLLNVGEPNEQDIPKEG